MKKIGLGTAAIGRPHYINIRKEAAAPFSFEKFKQRGKRMLEEAYQLGVRYFDTAPGYGMAEQMLNEWINENEYPDLEIATKWGYTYTANFNPNATQHEVKEHSLKKLNEQWAFSKNFLPKLTTYQIHSATFDTGVLINENVLNRLFELKEQHGLLMGITSTGDNQVEVIKKALDVHIKGQQLFDAFQITFNILDQSLLSISKKLHEQNKRIIIKEALANGRLFPNKKFPHYNNLYSVLQRLAKKHKVGIDAVALRFCIDAIDPYMVLSGASKSEHLIDNLKALNIKLEKKDLMEFNQFNISPKIYWSERKKLSWN